MSRWRGAETDGDKGLAVPVSAQLTPRGGDILHREPLRGATGCVADEMETLTTAAVYTDLRRLELLCVCV